ncbi:MAG: LysR family transcriptional regulator [Pseudomonadota bacterium]
MGGRLETTRRRAAAPALKSAGAIQKMTWDDLKVALAVGRAGSLARAAEVLGVDPATVSRRITALETALGAILFTRTKLGVVPTDAGSAVIGRATEIEHRTLLMEEEIAAINTAKGAVRVAGGMWTMARMAGVAAPLLRALHPDLSLRLVACRPPVDLPSGLPTVSLFFEASPRENEFSITLGQTPYALFAPAGADVDALPLLSHRNEDGPARAPDRWASREASNHAATPLMATDSLILREAIRAGLGKGLLPLCLAKDDPKLRRVGAAEPDLTRPLQMHVHPDIIQFVRVRTLIDALRANFDVIFGAGEAAAAPLADTADAVLKFPA